MSADASVAEPSFLADDSTRDDDHNARPDDDTVTDSRDLEQQSPSSSSGSGSGAPWPTGLAAPASASTSGAVPSYDAGIRRLILLQTLAARQAALLQAQSRALAAVASSNGSGTSVLSPRSHQSYPPPLSSSPRVNGDSVSSPIVSPPPPPPTPVVNWGPDAIDPWPGPSPVASTSKAVDSPPPGQNWSNLSENELQQQLDAWGASFPPIPPVPPLYPLTIPPATSTVFDWSGAASTLGHSQPYPSLTPPIHPTAPFPSFIDSPSTFFPSSMPSWPPPTNAAPPPTSSTDGPTSQTASPSSSTSRRPSLAVRSGSTSKGKGTDEDPGSGDEDDKRRRNTEASARFRAKKKQRETQLQQTSIQLRERVTDLEKEATSLKAENQWLRELISEKSDPR